MAIASKLITGLIKGLGGPDFDDLLDDLTKKAGEQIGHILNEIVFQSGGDLQESEERLDKWIRENTEKAPVLTSAVAIKL